MYKKMRFDESLRRNEENQIYYHNSIIYYTINDLSFSSKNTDSISKFSIDASTATTAAAITPAAVTLGKF